MLALALLLLSGASTALAEVQPKKQNAPPVADKTETPPEAKEQASPPAKSRPKSKSLNEDLLKSLGDPASESSDDGDPLGEIIKRMRSAQQRIHDKDLSEETRALQTGVAKDLEELIKLLQQQQEQQQKESNQSQPPRSSKSDQQSSQRQNKQPQPQNSAKPMPGSDGAGERRQDNNEKSRDSTDKLGPNKPSPSEVARRQQMEKDIWGHLPPALRQEMLNTYTDKFLLKYDDLVRRYYEALAERNKRTP